MGNDPDRADFARGGHRLAGLEGGDWSALGLSGAELPQLPGIEFGDRSRQTLTELSQHGDNATTQPVAEGKRPESPHAADMFTIEHMSAYVSNPAVQ